MRALNAEQKAEQETYMYRELDWSCSELLHKADSERQAINTAKGRRETETYMNKLQHTRNTEC